MSDTTYQDLVNACQGFYGLEPQPPLMEPLPPRLEDALALQGEVETMQFYMSLPNVSSCL